MSEPPAISCRSLVKVFGSVVAVRGLDLEVRRGECFGLLGPNGAGTTTTLEILLGLTAATSGAVELFGRTWETDERWLRERVGVSLQETRFPEKLTVRDLLELFRSFSSTGRGADELLDVVALREKEHARAETLSGGQRQRLAVACALVGKPQLLFLDEPTTGLDPQSRRSLWDVLDAQKASGGTVLLTTHYMDEADRLCDRVAIIDRGKCIALGSPAELKRGLNGGHGAHFADVTSSGPWPEGALEALPAVSHVTQRGEEATLRTSDLHVTLPALVARSAELGLTLTRLATHEATLEDVFVSLTGRQLRD